MVARDGVGDVASDGSTLSVQLLTLPEVAGILERAGGALGGAGRGVGSAGTLAEPVVREALKAFTVAWGTALEVIGEDVQFLSGQVDGAAAAYMLVDEGFAGIPGS